MKVVISTEILLTCISSEKRDEGLSLLFSWIKKAGGTCYTDYNTLIMLHQLLPKGLFAELKDIGVLQIPRKLHAQLLSLKQIIDGMHKPNIPNINSLLRQINWLIYGDADYIVSENGLLHDLSATMHISERVYNVEDFIEKLCSENRDKDNDKGIAIHKVKFGSLDFNDPFFDSFKNDYNPYYTEWFHKKAGDDVYVAHDEDVNIRGLLKLKIEDLAEGDNSIVPQMRPARRLKICSLKAHITRQKLGQRFMRIIFETALTHKVDEIYITIIENGLMKKTLADMVQQWGFVYYGTKNKNESVYVRMFAKEVRTDLLRCFPYHSPDNNIFIIPMLRTEATHVIPPISLLDDDKDVEPYKQAIKKSIILNDMPEGIKKGSILLFYQLSADIGYRYLLGVGVVDGIYSNFNTEYLFRLRSKKRSLMDDIQLQECWRKANGKPIVVDFLYTYYFGGNINNCTLEYAGIDHKTLKHLTPIEIDKIQFYNIIKNTDYAKTIVVD